MVATFPQSPAERSDAAGRLARAEDGGAYADQVLASNAVSEDELAASFAQAQPLSDAFRAGGLRLEEPQVSRDLAESILAVQRQYWHI